MKKVISLMLAIAMVFCFASCGAPKLEGVEAPIDILNKVWSSYGEAETFFAMGGDYNNMVENAPGAVDITDTATLQSLLACPENAAGMIDGAASLIHAMNANTFTGAAYHIADGKNADEFITAMQEGIANQQWLCGAPEQLLIAKLSADYVVVAYGAADLVNTFSAKLTAAYETTEAVVNEALTF